MTTYGLRPVVLRQNDGDGTRVEAGSSTQDLQYIGALRLHLTLQLETYRKRRFLIVGYPLVVS